MTKLNKRFTATLKKSGAKGGWTYVVMPGSAEFFGTRGLVKVRGRVDGRPRQACRGVRAATPAAESGCDTSR